MYNLADIIRYNFDCGLDFDRDTIVYKYISQVKNKLVTGRNYDYYYKHGNPLPNVEFKLLRDIVNNHQPIKKQDDAIAIHCRIGDMLGRLDLMNAVINVINRNDLNKIYKQCRLYFGTHTNHNKQKSRLLLLNIKDELLRQFNLHTEIISSDVDPDFCSLSNEACYIPTIGGFSWLSASINPNNVIWDIHKDYSNRTCALEQGLNQIEAGYNNQAALRRSNRE